MDIRVEDNNLLDYSDWTIDSTTVNFATATPFGGHYEIIKYDISPFGHTDKVWEIGSTLQDTGRNGWQYYYNVDNTKNYRFSYWTKTNLTNTSSCYLRTYGYDGVTLSGLSYVVNSAYNNYRDSYATTNYTFDDMWVLNVVHLKNKSWTGTTNNDESGLWSGTTKMEITNDVKFVEGVNRINHRVYLYYGTDLSGTTVQFIYPRLDLVDGTEPSINTLLTNEGMWRSGTTYIKVEDNNLLSYKNWSGLTCGDIAADSNGSYWNDYVVAGTTNCRILDTDPWGNINPIWRCSSTGATTYGGFNMNTGNHQYINCDPTQDYRFSCWFNKKTIITTKKGAFYFGCRATSGTTAQQIQNKSIYNLTNNPYFVYNTNIQNIEEDEWYLLVGYLYKVGTITGGTMNSAMYNLSGIKITGWTCTDFINNNTVTDLTIRIAPIYEASGCTAYIAYPRIDLIDGTEPSIATLLSNEGQWRDVDSTQINIGDTWKTIT